MIITNEKILVTDAMLVQNGMFRDGLWGVPLYDNPSKGLIWKRLDELEDSDFEKWENYFLNKTNH